MAPIHTDLLPSLKIKAPPFPGPDHTQPTFAVLLDALRVALGATKSFIVKKETLTCDEVIRKDAEELLRKPFDDKAEGLLFGTVKTGVSLLAPEFAGVVEFDE